MSSAQHIADVKVLARKIATENDTAEFLKLALSMHRLLDEFLRAHLKPRTN